MPEWLLYEFCYYVSFPCSTLCWSFRYEGAGTCRPGARLC